MEAHVPRRSRRRRLTIAVVAIALLGAIAAVVLPGGDDEPADTFYELPDPPAGPPGTILRSQMLARPPPGATAVRILYRSRGYRGRPVTLSALLFVPLRPARVEGRNIVALAHGTVGVARACAVSSGRSFWPHVDGLARFIRAGDVVVVPDFEGLGTPGPHPYLVGEATAHAMLDAVRAARRFAQVGASARFIAWGIGQGGHAALFTGQEAGDYAPELELAGVAAGAPIANLRRLLDADRDTPYGRVLAAYTLATWSRVYPQVQLDEVVGPASRKTIDALSKRCVAADHASIEDDLDVALAYRTKNPWAAAPLKGLLARNTPGAKPIPVPVIITQGADDRRVPPALTRRFVRYLCSQGTTVQYRASRRVAHVDLGEKTAPYVSKWIVGRFAGRRARSTC